MDRFDYTAPAELFPSRNRKIASKVKYRRFDRAADAIRFAMEELPEPLLLGATIDDELTRIGRIHVANFSMPVRLKAQVAPGEV